MRKILTSKTTWLIAPLVLITIKFGPSRVIFLLLIRKTKKLDSLLPVDGEYTDWISGEGEDSPKECPGYDMKESDGEASVMLEL